MSAVLLGSITSVVTFMLGIATHWLTTRRTLALQYDADLRRDRLEVYADLWSRLEVLNKYGRSSQRLSLFDAKKLVADLKHWYFQSGGIYLSVPTRNDYFGLQDALHHALATASREREELLTIDGAAFEFVRVRGSRLRTSLTRDVGTRKTLKLRGDPERPPLPKDLGTYRCDADGREIGLSARRSMRIAGRQLGNPIAVRAPVDEKHAKWKMKWDGDAFAIDAVRTENGKLLRRQLILEGDRLIEGPSGWDPETQSEDPAPVTWSRLR